MPEGEVLLVDGAPPEATGHYQVIGRLEPNILVLRAERDHVAALATTARFAIGKFPDGTTLEFGDAETLNQLDPGAQLFVTAWREKLLTKENRPGEGLPWDAPGFEPPGPPTQ